MKKRCRGMLAVLLMAVLCFSVVPVSAAQVNNEEVYPVTTNEMEGWPQCIDLYSETAVLMDADTGTILYNKGMDELRYPASTTKVMTTLLAIENSSMEDQVTFTDACLADQEAGSMNIGMQVGEVLTMEQCLMAVMIQSANDVSTQVAVQIGGSVENFVEMMNQRAEQLGCKNTHFVNASGMPDENHYTTAYDMALIFREALKNDTFRQIIGTISYTIEPTNMNPEARTYSTHQPIFAPGTMYHIDGCLGGKTGNTDASMSTLVTGAEQNGMTLIAVAMRADAGEVAMDHFNLFNYGYDNFKKVDVPGGSVVIPNDKNLEDLTIEETETSEGTQQIYYYNQNYFVGSGLKSVPEATPTAEPTVEATPTVEPTPTEEPEPTGLLPTIKNVAKSVIEKIKNLDFDMTDWYIISALAGFVVIWLVLMIVLTVHKKKRKKKGKRKS